MFEKTENKRKRGHFLKNRKKSKRGKEREREIHFELKLLSYLERESNLRQLQPLISVPCGLGSSLKLFKMLILDSLQRLSFYHSKQIFLIHFYS